MPIINRSELRFLHRASDIQYIWNAAQSLEIINHPEFGWISPFWDRAYNKNKACPYCDKNMVHGQELYSTSSKQEAIERGYQYEYFCKHEQQIKNTINKAGDKFFHPN